MELLKSSIPVNLRTLILSTPASDLSSSCAALVQYFSSTSHFSEFLEQLVSPDLTCCAKEAAGAAKWKRDGNAAFGSQDYDRALSSYTKALRYAPLASNEEETRASCATLFINRAAALHKVGLLESAIRDCDRALDLHPLYSKAWYRRGRLKSDLSDFAGAVMDMEKAHSNETTSGGQLQIEKELAQIESNLRLAHGSECTRKSPLFPNPVSKSTGASSKVMELQNSQGMGHLQKHWTKGKGWSLQTKKDMQMGSLVFQEDPYAAVVLKSSRDTHCHFCFELLPADPVACSGCAIPLYCSDFCRACAIGSLGGGVAKFIHVSSERTDNWLVPGIPLATSVTQYFQGGNYAAMVQGDLGRSCQRWGEHLPECGGASWSAVLASGAVLAARMLFRTSRLENGVLRRTFSTAKGAEDSCEVDTLCHHYDILSPNDKMEMHVLGIVIAHCVKQSAVPLLETGTNVAAIASKLLRLIAQARVNAMAIFGMSSPDFCEGTGNINSCRTRKTVKDSVSTSTSLCTVEQVKVAQGIFLVGNRLNHSCVPNIHASFELGRLFIRAVTKITQGSPLELCYGPQVGELNQLERKQQLLESYFFACTCPACSKSTLPDLFLRSFRCVTPHCMGVVLGPESLESKFSGTGSSNFSACIGVGEEENRDVEGCLWPGEKESQHLSQSSTAAIDVSLVDKKIARASLICKVNTGRCLSCGMVVDIKTAHEVARTATAHLERVESHLVKVELDGRQLQKTLKGALKVLNTLRVTVHAYNEQLAKGEDIVARLLCALDQPLKALKHCQRSIEILERLFNKQHIVVGNEYLKLASVALMVPDLKCARESLARVDQIFNVHYGSDYRSRLSYVVQIQEMAQ